MSSPPAFQLYAADFYMDTIGWSNEEVGFYLRLLLIEWINGPLPGDIKALIKASKTHHKTFNKLWIKVSRKFVNDGDGKLINKRLEKVREKQLKYIESQREAGKKGAEKRWKNDGDCDSKPNRVANRVASSEKMALQSSSSSLKKNPYIPFQEIVEYLNKKSGKNFKWQNKKTQSQIRARWKEGSTLEDFKHVIDIKCQKWLSDPEMVDFVRPVTLFGTKFEGYKNESRPKPKSRLIS